jgi:hypothetical protein
MVLHRRRRPVRRSGLFPAGVSIMAPGRSPTCPRSARSATPRRSQNDVAAPSSDNSLPRLTSPPPLSNVRARRDGAVAQLGERLVRNEEARGSSPLSSTTVPHTALK